jgi:two-component system CheB/CheR fusion protein
VLESTHDVTASRATEHRLRLLLSELTHRVRNTLAVIQAIARHTLRNSKSKEDFVVRFEGRLAALASAHTLLVGSDWKGADLAELARQQLVPYITDNPDRLRLQGEPISLSADLATPFGLVLHELATNAAKYGSLSVSSGTVGVSWTTSRRNNERMLKLIWKEGGGPRPGKPKTNGFGNTLIDSVITGAHVEREFRPTGFVCTIEIALQEAADDGAAGQVN